MGLIFRDEKICLICKKAKAWKIDYVCRDCYERLVFMKTSLYIEGYDGVRSVLVFDDFIKPLVYNYKYEFASYYYKAFASIILAEGPSLDDIDCIIPVPLTKKRERRRGFNQSYLLAKYLAQEKSLEVHRDLLVKTRDTKEQHKLDLRERRSNLDSAFELLDKDRIKDKRVLIIDDILTSGSTLKECGRTLGHYPREIYGLSLARAKK